MFSWLQSRVVWGVLLIVAGVMFLLQAVFNIQTGTIFWGILFILAGVFFFSFYINNRQNWWPIIPGCVLTGIGVGILLTGLFPRLPGSITGVFVLGGIGASFVWIYLHDRRNWWAIIPAGVMLTLVIVNILDGYVGGQISGGIVLIGIGLTFAVLAMINTPTGKMAWSWIPSIVLVIIGLGLIYSSGQLSVFVLPAVLILGGLFLLIRVVATRPS